MFGVRRRVRTSTQLNLQPTLSAFDFGVLEKDGRRRCWQETRVHNVTPREAQNPQDQPEHEGNLKSESSDLGHRLSSDANDWPVCYQKAGLGKGRVCVKESRGESLTEGVFSV